MAREKWLLPRASLRRLAKPSELAIFTGRVRAELDYTLDRCRVREFFQQIVTVEDVRRPKPDPEGLLKILNGRDPANALYLGDNVDDALAARAARIPFLGVLPRKSEARRARGALLRKLGARRSSETSANWKLGSRRSSAAPQVPEPPSYQWHRTIGSTKKDTVPLPEAAPNASYSCERRSSSARPDHGRQHYNARPQLLAPSCAA